MARKLARQRRKEYSQLVDDTGCPLTPPYSWKDVNRMDSHARALSNTEGRRTGVGFLLSDRWHRQIDNVNRQFYTILLLMSWNTAHWAPIGG